MRATTSRRGCGRRQRSGSAQHLIDFVGDDHAVVDRAEPTGHDDSDTSRVIQAWYLLWQGSRDRQPLELGSKTGAKLVLGVVMECLGSGSIDQFDFIAAVGYVFFQGIEGGLDQVLLAGLIFLIV